MKFELEGWERLPDGDGKRWYRTMGNGWQGVVSVRPLREEEQMPRDPQALVNGVYHYLPGNIAVLDIVSATLENGTDYLYVLQKQQAEPAGVDYTFTAQFFEDTIWEVQGWFAAAGVSGQRDAVLFEYFQRLKAEGKIDDETPWLHDPFNPNNEGFAAHWGEQENFDESFPDHPLSRARETLRVLINQAADSAN